MHTPWLGSFTIQIQANCLMSYFGSLTAVSKNFGPACLNKLAKNQLSCHGSLSPVSQICFVNYLKNGSCQLLTLAHCLFSFQTSKPIVCHDSLLAVSQIIFKIKPIYCTSTNTSQAWRGVPAYTSQEANGMRYVETV